MPLGSRSSRGLNGSGIALGFMPEVGDPFEGRARRVTTPRRAGTLHRCPERLVRGEDGLAGALGGPVSTCSSALQPRRLRSERTPSFLEWSMTKSVSTRVRCYVGSWRASEFLSE
jgi:hypothetical protein